MVQWLFRNEIYFRIKLLFIYPAFIFVTRNNFANQKLCYCNKSLKGQYIIHKNKNYHHSCYDKHIQIYCDQCRLKIDGSYNTSNGKLSQKLLPAVHTEKM